MTTLQARLDEMLAVARRATPGPWLHYHDKLRAQFSVVVDEVQGRNGAAVVAWGGFDAAPQSAKKRRANAAHIAQSNPAVFAALVEVARATADHKHEPKLRYSRNCTICAALTALESALEAGND